MTAHLLIYVIVTGLVGLHQFGQRTREHLCLLSSHVWKWWCCRSSCLPSIKSVLPFDDAVRDPSLWHRTRRKAVTTSWAFLFSTKVVMLLTSIQRKAVSWPLLTAFFIVQGSYLCFFLLLHLWSFPVGQPVIVDPVPVWLVNGRWYFHPFINDELLLLQLCVRGPFDKMIEVLVRRHVLFNAKVMRLSQIGSLPTFHSSCFSSTADAKATIFPLTFYLFSISSSRRRDVRCY